MALLSGLLNSTLFEHIGRLRFPTLFCMLVVLFLVDLFIPDVVPLVDELLLALATLVVGSLKRRHDENPENEKIN